MSQSQQLNIGYLPLLDSVALLWAKQQGYFLDEDLTVNLIQENSWASLRDRLAFGVFDAAHCLSAMLPAAHLGQDALGIALQTQCVLSHNRAFISLSQKLCYDLKINAHDHAQSTAHKLVNSPQFHSIRLAHVAPASIHHYCLREWLALADVEQAKNLTLFTAPPPTMLDSLSQHIFDGFCVGEPWNSQASLAGYGQIVARSQDIIPTIADKVLATTKSFAQQHPQCIAALSRALLRAQNDLTQDQYFADIWHMLCKANIIQFDCSLTRHVQTYQHLKFIIQNLIQTSAQPQQQDFLWLIEQMQKWQNLHISAHQKHQVAQQCVGVSNELAP